MCPRFPAKRICRNFAEVVVAIDKYKICLSKYRCSFSVIRKLCTETATLEDYYDLTEPKRPHIPVMLKEVIESLKLKEGDRFLDMTFGAGGHSRALLERCPSLKVFALDRDPVVRGYAEKLEEDYPNQVTFLQGKFSDLATLLESNDQDENSFDGVLFDLGCSSMQFDIAERGFASNREGPLDMRMDGDRIPGQITAADVIAYADERDLMKIFKVYGGEKNALRLARGIVAARSEFEPLKTTKQLVELIETVLKGQVRRDKIHRRTNLSTKAFLALRTFVNNEMNELNNGLSLVHKYLKPGGRAVVLTFNSNEDTIVKRHFKNTNVDMCMNPLPLIYINPTKVFTNEEIEEHNLKLWEPIHKKVILPSVEEVNMNARSRSAKLRAAVKL